MPDRTRSDPLVDRLEDLVRDAAADHRGALARASELRARLTDVARDLLAMAVVVEQIKRSPPGEVAVLTGHGPVRVATYSRVIGHSDEHRRSLRAQRKRLKAVAHSHGWRLVREFTDRATGADTHRPGLQNAISQARVGRFDILVVHTIHRLARSPRVLLQVLNTLRDAGVAVHVATAETEVGPCQGC